MKHAFKLFAKSVKMRYPKSNRIHLNAKNLFLEWVPTQTLNKNRWPREVQGQDRNEKLRC